MRSVCIALLLASAADAFSPQPALSPASLRNSRAVSRQPVVRMDAAPVVPIKTVGESLVAFQKAYTKPILPLFNPFIRELLTTNTLALGSPRFKYDRIYAAGFLSICDLFLDGYPRKEEKPALISAMISALELDESKIRADAAEMTAWAAGKTEADIMAAINSGGEGCAADFKQVCEDDSFYYCQPFGAGLFAVMEAVGTEVTDDSLDKWCEAMSIRSKRAQDDFRLFQRSQKQLIEMKSMMLDNQLREKQKAATALQEKADKAAKEAAEAEKEASSA